MKSLKNYILERHNFLVNKHSSKDTFDISKINAYNGIVLRIEDTNKFNNYSIEVKDTINTITRKILDGIDNSNIRELFLYDSTYPTYIVYANNSSNPLGWIEFKKDDVVEFSDWDSKINLIDIDKIIEYLNKT